jgi:hypothetical protein
MNIKNFVAITLAFAVLLLTPVNLLAATKTTAEFGNQNATLEQFTTVGWNKNCVVQKFDTSLGELNKVIFTLDGSIQVTEYKVENVQNNSVNLNSTLTSNIAATLPGSTSILSAPSVTYARNLASYDGTSDYAGASGFQFPNQSNTKSVIKEISDGNKDQFKGSGTITIPVTSDGSTTVTISSNADYRVRTEAKALCKVQYEYSTPNDVSVRKTHSGSSYVQEGSDVNFLLTVKNEAQDSTEGAITVTDNLPSTLSYVGFSGDGWTCNNTSGTVTCTTSKVLTSKTSDVVTIKTKVNTGASGVLTNNVCVKNSSDTVCPTTCDISTSSTDKNCNNKSIDWVTVGVAPTSAPTTTSAPSCNDAKPTCKPDLFQINVTDSKAILYLNPCSGSICKKYFVSYGTKENAEDYNATFDAPTNPSGAVTYEVNVLNAATKYYFKVKCVNGCSSGEYGNILSATTNGKNDTCVNQYYANGTSGKGACGGDSSQVLGASTSSKSGNVLGATTGSVLASTGFWVISSLIIGTGILFILFALKRKSYVQNIYKEPVYKRISKEEDEE